MRKVTYSIFYLMLFSPILSWISVVLFGGLSTTIYFKLIIFLYGMIFIFRSNSLYIPKFLYPLLIYIIYRCTWSYYNGEFVTKGILPILFKSIDISILFALIIIYNTKFSHHFIKNSIAIFKITILLGSVASITQVFLPDFLSPWNYYGIEDDFTSSIYENRRTSIFGFVNQNELGLSFLPIGSLVFSYLLKNKQKTFILFSLLVGICSLLSNSRYIMIGFLLLNIQYIKYNKISLTSALKYIALFVVITGSIFVILKTLGYNYEEFYENRLFKEEKLTNTTRYLAYEVFLEYFPKNPIVGTGVHINKDIEDEIGGRSSQIHVGYFSHLVSYGIIGSFFLFGFWFLLIKRLYRSAAITNFWGSFFALIVFFWAQLTLVNYSIFFTGILFALIFDKYYIDNYNLLARKKKLNLELSHTSQ